MNAFLYENLLIKYCSLNNVLIVKDILGAIPNLNVNVITNISGDTPLLVASKNNNGDLVSLLLAHGASVNFRNVSGKTALFISCEYGYTKLIDILLSEQADITCLNDAGESALYIAIVQRRSRIADTLLQYGSQFYKGKKATIYRPYYQLCSYILKGDISALDTGLQNSEDVNFPGIKDKSLLFYAVCAGNLEAVKVLLKNGVKVNGNGNESVLHVAIFKNEIDIIKLLLDFNVDAEQIGDCYFLKNVRPLFLAAFMNHIDELKMLLEYGVDVDARSDPEFSYEGQTALFGACYKKNFDCARLLLQYKADINAKDQNDNTILQTCIYYPETVKWLLNNGFDLNIMDKKGRTPLHWALVNKDSLRELLGRGELDVEARDKEGKTPLFVAASEFSTYEALEVLLDSTEVLNTDVRDNLGNTPLHDNFVFRLNSWITCENMGKLLCHGWNLNVQNSSGHYPVPTCQRFEVLYEIQSEITECPVINYINKVELLGYVLNVETLSFCLNTKQYKSDKLVIDYANELLTLKNISICKLPVVTLKDVLTMKSNKIVKFSENKILKELYINYNGNFENKFAHYGWLLNLQYQRGLLRKKLINQAKRSLNSMLGIDLIEDCTEKIFCYLNNSQLRDFNKQDES